MIVAIQHGTAVLHDNADERLELGIISGHGAVAMVQLQELPRRF